MSKISLEDQVKEVVSNFVKTDTLFTALDVSNEVKKVLPFARHKEVRDIVRGLFASDIQPSSYGRTSIEVIISDGSKQDALLYHPLSDSWDLDVKYDLKRRDSSEQASSVPSSAPPSPLPVSPKDIWNNLFGTFSLTK